MRTTSSKETQKAAEKVAQLIIERGPRKSGATTVALSGDLGSGKTTFAQGFAKALSITEHITSPTFLIFRKYPVRRQKSNVKCFHFFYHVDVYRLEDAKQDLHVIGFDSILKDEKNIVLIEWAERIRDDLPQNAQWIYFEHTEKENEREIRTRHLDIKD